MSHAYSRYLPPVSTNVGSNNQYGFRVNVRSKARNWAARFQSDSNQGWSIWSQGENRIASEFNCSMISQSVSQSVSQVEFTTLLGQSLDWRQMQEMVDFKYGSRAVEHAVVY